MLQKTNCRFITFNVSLTRRVSGSGNVWKCYGGWDFCIKGVDDGGHVPVDTFHSLLPSHLRIFLTGLVNRIGTSDGMNLCNTGWQKQSLTTSIVCEYAARTGFVCSLKLFMRTSTASPERAVLYWDQLLDQIRYDWFFKMRQHSHTETSSPLSSKFPRASSRDLITPLLTLSCKIIVAVMRFSFGV